MPSVETLPAASAAADASTRTEPIRTGPLLVQRLAWGLIGVALLVRIWVLTAGFFYWDDYVFMGHAAAQPLFSREYLLRWHDGHLMPAAFAVAWVVERIGRLSFVLPILVMAAAQAAVWWAWYRLLLRLFGPRLGIVAPLALVLLSPLAMPSAVWWAAALNALPLQLGMVLAVHGLVSWREGRVRAGLAQAAGGMVLALLFFEKGIVIAPLLLGLALVLDTSRPVIPALRHTLWADARLWTVLGGLLGLYIVGFVSIVDKQPSSPDDWAAAAGTLITGTFQGVLPAVTGGPLTWSPIGYGSAIATPPQWWLWLSGLAVLILVAATSWLRPRARRAWTLAGLYVVGALLLFVLGRLGPLVAPEVTASLRYTSEAIIPIGLALGMSLLPVRGEPAQARERLVSGWVARHRRAVLITGFVALDAFVCLAVYSQAQFRPIWAANESRPWITQSSASLAEAWVDGGDDRDALLAQPVPDRVLYGLAYPWNLSSNVLAPLRQRPAFADYTDSLRLIDDEGELVPAEVVGVTALPGPVEECSWLVDDTGGRIALPESTPLDSYTASMDYFAATDTTATVTLGTGDPVPVRLFAGLHELHVRLVGSGPVLSFDGLADGASACIGEVEVGEVRVTPEDAQTEATDAADRGDR